MQEILSQWAQNLGQNLVIQDEATLLHPTLLPHSVFLQSKKIVYSIEIILLQILIVDPESLRFHFSLR